jgi:hypothetical protein
LEFPFSANFFSLFKNLMSEIEPLFVQYLDTEPIKVDPTGCRDIADFIKKAQKEFSPELDELPLNKLTLHRYTGTKLKGDLKITSLIKSNGFVNNYDNPLLIRYADDALPVVKKTHKSQDRKRRWDELNPILIEVAAKNKKLKESAAYSSLTWKLISPIYKLQLYSQPVKEVPSETIEYIQDYLSKAHRGLGALAQGNESKRLHFIAPILICIVILFGPNDPVEIVIEEDLSGEQVKANGHFEFMLKRKDKIVCIVEAKHYDLQQGIAQDLVGMEVASDVDDLDVVYGIVTNYAEWIFLKNHNDKVEMDEDVLKRENGTPTLESLKRITGKIYALLSDD